MILNTSSVGKIATAEESALSPATAANVKNQVLSATTDVLQATQDSDWTATNSAPKISETTDFSADMPSTAEEGATHGNSRTD